MPVGILGQASRATNYLARKRGPEIKLELENLIRSKVVATVLARPLAIEQSYIQPMPLVAAIPPSAADPRQRPDAGYADCGYDHNKPAAEPLLC